MSWREVRLGDWAPLTYGKALPEPTRIPGQVPVYSSAGATGTHSTALVDRPSVIVGRKGNVGTVFYVPEPSFPIDTAFYTLGSEREDLRFIAYKLRSMRLSQHTRDSAVPGLRRDDYSQLRTLVPPLAEQQAIAEVLGALDDKIAANASLATSLEAIAAATAASTQGRVFVSDVATLEKKQVHPSTLGSTLVDHYSLPAFDANRLPARDGSDSIKSGKFVVDRTSVLVSKLNPRFPRVWLAEPSSASTPALASTEFLVLAPRDDVPERLWALLASPAFSRSLESKVAGTSGSHQRVKPADVLAEEIGDPASLSDSATSLVVASVRQVLVARRESRTLTALRDALLPELMSGRLRVRDAERTVEEAI